MATRRLLSAAFVGLCGSAAAAPMLPPLGSYFGQPGRSYTFDYIVVGGGQAGLTVATRLAENASLQVGVVEAGTFYELTNSNHSEIPAMAVEYAGKAVDDWQPGIDWGFVTTPQEALLNASVHYPRGKCLGGNSARNYMTYHPGTAGSYQMWADAVGDDSYTFDNFWPYFQKSQNFTPPDSSRRFANATPRYDASVLGTDGPLSVIFPNYAGGFGTWVEKGLAAVGINPIDGFQNGSLIGSSYALATINYDTNLRDSSETAFLRPALENPVPNLVVFPNTMAKRVLFDDTKKAIGVEVSTDGLSYTLNATAEVVLSAGSFQSPQLLMVSGIGPASTLQKHDIPVLADRPGVGQNLTDHVLFGTSHRVAVNTSSSFAYGTNLLDGISQFRDGRGPLTSPNVDVFGWEKLPRNASSSAAAFTAANIADLATFPTDWPEIEYIAPGAYFGYSENYQVGAPADGFNYASIIAGMVAPLSRGSVSIASADAADLPVVDPNWLSHPTDKAVAIAAFKRTRDIWGAAAMDGVKVGEGEYFPGTAEVSTDEEIWGFVQKSFNTIFHAACTCRMGRADDPNAVVDGKARVIGVRGLRVVDASALALLPPGHPMSTIYALAEKIAEDILMGR